MTSRARARRLVPSFALLLALGVSQPASAFVRLTRQDPGGPVVQAHWLDAALPLLSVIDPTNADLAPATALAIVQASAETWENVSTAYFTVNPVAFDAAQGHLPPALDATDGQNSVFFDGTGVNFPTAGVIAFVRTIVDTTDGHTLDADMVFNDRDFFSSTTDPLTPAPPPTPPAPAQSSVDLQAVITHEYGHYFGLDHTSVAGNTMIPFIQNNTSQRTLELDDRAGISTIYPESVARGLSPGAVDFLATTGTVTGTVVSGLAGTAIFGAHVEAVNLAAPGPASSISAISGELTLRAGRGEFTLYGLPPGSYAIRIVPLDGIRTTASDGNVGGVFNGLDVGFEVEFWNGTRESAIGFDDPPGDFDPVSVAAGATSSGVDFLTNTYPGRVVVAQHGQFENTVTFANNASLAVRFDLPFEPPFTITNVEFPPFTFNGVPAPFTSARLVRMNPATGNPDLVNPPLFSQAPFLGSPNGVNTVPLGLTVTERNQTLFWIVGFPAVASAVGFPNNFPFVRMDFTDQERGLFANSHSVNAAGVASVLVDRNLAVTMTLQLPLDAVPIAATSALGANRRATHTELSYAAPADVRLDESSAGQNALDHVELVARAPGGPGAVLQTVATGGAGAGAIRLEPPPSSTVPVIWTTQAVDKSGRRSLPSSVAITGFAEDADEPNGRLNEARLLSPPISARPETYAPAGDQDYFAVVARPGQVITATATHTPLAGQPLLDLTMVLLDHTGRIVAFNDDTNGLNPRIAFTVPAREKTARRYTLLVTDFYGSLFDPTAAPRQRAANAYNLDVTVAAPPAPAP
jgi:hypothetical protein